MILGTKIGMSQVFTADRVAVPVTVVEALPNTVIRTKTKENDGYSAVQVGYGEQKEEKQSKPRRGQTKDLKKFFRILCEFPTIEGKESKPGDTINCTVFKPGDRLDIRGVSKGKGFQGVVKRHHFAGGPASHGHRHALRSPGSIGAAFPQHVRKGVRMAGRMGGEQVTVKNIEVVEVRAKENVIVLKGAVPGPKGRVLKLCPAIKQRTEQNKVAT